MNIEKLKNAIEIVKLMECDNHQENNSKYLGIKIVILHRGWILVGNLYKINDYFELKNSYVIRKWGTTDGLGQIATNGPTLETKLDKNTSFQFHELTMVGMMDCNKEKWSEYVKG